MAGCVVNATDVLLEDPEADTVAVEVVKNCGICGSTVADIEQLNGDEVVEEVRNAAPAIRGQYRTLFEKIKESIT